MREEEDSRNSSFFKMGSEVAQVFTGAGSTDWRRSVQSARSIDLFKNERFCPGAGCQKMLPLEYFISTLGGKCLKYCYNCNRKKRTERSRSLNPREVEKKATETPKQSPLRNSIENPSRNRGFFCRLETCSI